MVVGVAELEVGVTPIFIKVVRDRETYTVKVFNGEFPVYIIKTDGLF